ncbi:hypothetical protein 3Fb_00024 [Ralstonia phage Eline]|uniref:Uncharacterized protein n=2 Tax=Cimandefvirus TaxID=2843366 RepID=A0A7G5B9Q4_9CAUD|nr:hypothetical protein KMC45_gp24 [Ralstonia phage Eline]YP_010078469.1 hypothetical protein KMC47_gp47 [Ralstonia phage Gerry]QMV33027.1 hypothetical protein 3Fb_00024 [Ralstonia phage Eline]QMV33236.1 hypothetical protein 23F_00076 [Ralstonia phage Gerry]
MTDDQIRMIAERMDLEDKIRRLRATLRAAEQIGPLGIEYAERVRMRNQLGAMVMYLEILNERISAFRGDKE